jgi:hypothetical protein
LIEAVAALVLLGFIMALTVQLLTGVGVQRRAAERRVWALAAAENTIDRVSGLPWKSLDEASLSALKLDEATASRLPSGRLSVAVAEVAGVPPSKRLTVEVRWKGRSGEDERPVRLTTWVYQKGDQP